MICYWCGKEIVGLEDYVALPDVVFLHKECYWKWREASDQSD
jgi:hypothetical protein